MFKRVVTGKRTGRWFTGLRNFSSDATVSPRLVDDFQLACASFGGNLTADTSRLGGGGEVFFWRRVCSWGGERTLFEKLEKTIGKMSEIRMGNDE